MPPKRGVAAVKKRNKNDRFIFVDSEGEEVDVGRATVKEQERENSGSSHLIDEAQGHQVAHEQQKLSKLPRRRSAPRQATGDDKQEQSTAPNGLNTLFNDLRDEGTNGVLDPVQRTRFSRAKDGRQRRNQRQRPTKSPKSVHERPTRSQSSTSPDTPPPVLSGATSNSTSAPLAGQTSALGPLHTALPKKQQFYGLPADAYKTQANLNMAFIPTSQQRHMRACMVCSIVRTYQQFHTSGCPNCEGFMELAGNSDAIQECTSQVFDGLMTIADTSKSWVARYQRLEGYQPGVYAVQVEGILPEDIIIAAENAGVHYIPRDGSASETIPVDQ